MTNLEATLALATAVIGGLISIGLIRLTYPLLERYALARPNARSSHRAPTPQGAGIAVIAATLSASSVALGWTGFGDLRFAAPVFCATLFIAAVGFLDDIRPIPVVPRLALQSLAVSAIIFTAPSDLQIFAQLPLWLERSLILLAGIWFINLVNFMDGLDWMTVAEVIPLTTAIIILGLSGCIPARVTIVASALLGATMGFAPFNRPVAKLFLGDVGSLPIGLLTGWFLLEMAYHQRLASALLLPMYYLCDATATLLWRLLRGEPIWVAHRSHFYQRATDNGYTVQRVVAEVFILNLVLSVSAIAVALAPSFFLELAALLVGFLSTTMQMYRFARPVNRDRSQSQP
jgi:UDP-N-acetylmuramyl pentapeptide phosphotransferase/UDP-N-acetylglucosamine-1-phosphate transferase